MNTYLRYGARQRYDVWSLAPDKVAWILYSSGNVIDDAMRDIKSSKPVGNRMYVTLTGTNPR